MADEHIVKFNRTMASFLGDLSASVPEVNALSEARDWMSALFNVDESNDKVMRMFMETLKGAKDVIANCNPSVFTNFSLLPSIISKEDMYNVFRSLTESDRGVCWKYLSKLFRTGKAALQALGEYDEEAECDMMMMKNDGSANALQTMIGLGPQGGSDLKDMVVSDGPIVTVAFKSMCFDMVRILTEGAPEDADVAELQAKVEDLGLTDDGLMEDFKLQYTQEASQGLVTDTMATMCSVGIPFMGVDATRRVLSSFPDGDALNNTCMQLGTLALTLQSVDQKTISAVEDVARNFVGMIQRGEIDISTMGNDPFSMLQMLSQSGIADNLMELIGEQGQEA